MASLPTVNISPCASYYGNHTSPCMITMTTPVSCIISVVPTRLTRCPRNASFRYIFPDCVRTLNFDISDLISTDPTAPENTSCGSSQSSDADTTTAHHSDSVIVRTITGTVSAFFSPPGGSPFTNPSGSLFPSFTSTPITQRPLCIGCESPRNSRQRRYLHKTESKGLLRKMKNFKKRLTKGLVRTLAVL